MVVRSASTGGQASARRYAGLTIFCEGLPQEIGTELGVGVEILEAAIFVLHLFSPRYQRRIQAANFARYL
jgi:hypothetical protein